MPAVTNGHANLKFPPDLAKQTRRRNGHVTAVSAYFLCPCSWWWQSGPTTAMTRTKYDNHQSHRQNSLSKFPGNWPPLCHKKSNGNIVVKITNQTPSLKRATFSFKLESKYLAVRSSALMIATKAIGSVGLIQCHRKVSNRLKKAQEKLNRANR